MESKALYALELYETSREQKLTENERTIFTEAYAMGMVQTVANAVEKLKGE